MNQERVSSRTIDGHSHIGEMAAWISDLAAQRQAFSMTRWICGWWKVGNSSWPGRK